jgi:formylglycine-generating enzyme required for sulfatase activity
VLDMAGNVGEWVSDHYDANYYSVGPDRDPTGPAGPQDRGSRGGGYDDDVIELRASERDGDDPLESDSDQGFRCAQSLE